MFSSARAHAAPVIERRRSAPEVSGSSESALPNAARAERFGHRLTEARAASGSDTDSAPIQAARKTKKQRQERERRVAAIDRLNRGSSASFDHLDPEVREGLLALEEAQPRKSAAKRNKAARAQLLREANLPSIVEVGAGTGAASTHLHELSRARRDDELTPPKRRARKAGFRRNAAVPYLATDVAAVGGKGKFLLAAKKAGLHVRGRVNANSLEEHFPEGSLDEVIGANAYGDRKVPGASYGLVRDTDRQGGTAWDDRFLRSAHRVLKPGGTVRLLARTNFLTDQRGGIPLAKTNKYLSPERDDLEQAPQLGYDVDVTSAQQPHDVHFYRPDTHPGKQKKLGPYNTEFEFTKRAGTGQLTIEGDAESDSGGSEADVAQGNNDDLDDFLLGEQRKQFDF